MLRYLARDHESAYTASELVEGTGIDPDSIHPVLNRLSDRGLVRHREPYWAIENLETVHDAWLFRSITVHLNEILGPEDPDEWLRAAAESEE